MIIDLTKEEIIDLLHCLEAVENEFGWFYEELNAKLKKALEDDH